MRSILIPSLAALVVVALSDAFLEPAIPDRVLLQLGPVQVTSDMIGLSLALGVVADPVASWIRGAV